VQISGTGSEYEADIVQRMAERFGVKGLFDNEATPESQIGLYVKTQRTAKGWSQQDLADRANTSKPQVSRIERDGKGEALSRVLVALADPSAPALVPLASLDPADQSNDQQPALGA
jgi:hypothetical protein